MVNCMKRIIEDLKWILSQKLYVIVLSITAACGYGFEIVNPIIGIDDTAVEAYFGDGLTVVMGRWTIFLINRVFPTEKFSPFMLELIGVILLCLGVTLFTLLLRRIIGKKMNAKACAIFACVFISNPIISEVYFFYLHNGVDLGYVLIALALWLFLDALETAGKKKVLPLIGSALLTWLAVGCYESFLILYIIGIFMILFLYGITRKDNMTFPAIATNLLMGAIVSLGVMLLRTAMIELLTVCFDLLEIKGEMQLRSLTEIFDTLRHNDGLANLSMLIKKYWVVYFVNAIVYLPVTGYVFSIIILGICSIVIAVKRRKFRLLVLFGGMVFTPFLLTLLEGQVAYYRSCQFLPFFTATGVLLLYLVVEKSVKLPIVHYGVLMLVVIMVYNQAAALNKNFYMDYLKYDNAREVMTTVAEEIERDFGKDKPVIFTGSRETPAELVEQYCVPYSSKQFQYISIITDLLDEHLKEKYYTPYGYSYAGEVSYSFIDWGVNAFDGTCSQLIQFLNMHGYSFTTIRDRNVQEGARQLGETMPRWPKEGSIVELENYILVHF